MSERESCVPPSGGGTQGEPIRVLIADDHSLVRQGLCMILHTEPDITVVGEAPDGATAHRLALELRPDVILADVSMPAPTGIELARLLRAEAPEVAILIVSMHADRAIAREALASGACGYVTKMADAPVLIHGIREAAAGRRFVDPAIRL